MPICLAKLQFGKLYFLLTLSCSCCLCTVAGFTCGYLSLCAVVQLHLSSEAHASGRVPNAELPTCEKALEVRGLGFFLFH